MTRPQYPGWQLDPDPLTVEEPEIGVCPVCGLPVGVGHILAWFGLGVCVGVLLLALLILGRMAIEGAGT